MKLRANWHATWTPWVRYTHHSGVEYVSRKRDLYVGRLCVATLVHSTLRARPFFMYTGDPRLRVSDFTAFRTVRAFMRQLR